jgi:L-ascorbate metabolism protein UlaG (beta-lactamase superfamily)
VSTNGSALRVTWLGHSTVLLQLDGIRLLTDPVLRSRLGHLRRVGSHSPRSALDSLDVALVSHVHHDHLDLPSLERLGYSLHVVVPAGAGTLLRRRGFTHVTEVDVGDELNIGTVAVRATHAEHEARRIPFGTSTPALGYLVTGSARVYFAGDTDLFEGMAELSPGLDVALLPVAGWGPRLPPGHLDPRHAAEALAKLRPRVAVPIHWGTYRRIGLDRSPALLQAPADSFARFAKELAPEVDVQVLPVNETLVLAEHTEAKA